MLEIVTMSCANLYSLLINMSAKARNPAFLLMCSWIIYLDIP